MGSTALAGADLGSLPGSPDPLSPGFSFSRTPHLLSLGQPHVPTFPVIQPIIQGLFSKQGLLASPQQLEDPHHHSPSWQEVWLHPAGDPCLHGRLGRLHCAPHGVGMSGHPDPLSPSFITPLPSPYQGLPVPAHTTLRRQARAPG